jgi:UDP:flavonoid glycosyltransferase YjiC (YdhE family)
MPDDLLRFLKAGDAPILFTMGSGMGHAREFYETATQAVHELDRRAIFVTRFPEQIPDHLGPNAMHASYAPYDQLLPHCAAIVHHGGIGTVAQALAAGTPQLGVPGIVFDTPDNVIRIKHLGAGQMVPIDEFNLHNAVAALDRLLHDPNIKQRCMALAARTREQDGALETVKALERL